MKNREIKFRAWDNKKKEWLFGYELPNLGGFSLVLLMKLLAFVFVPVLGVMMLLLMDAMVPKR
mgnify:CR=1 FL=1